MAHTQTVKLNSGYEMPIIGFGIWKVPKESTAETVYNAIKLGYRHFDGAHDYTNSEEAGQGVRKAIADGLVKREELFITSKLWNNYHKYEHAVEMAKYENDLWGVGYLDLFLIHFPVALEHIPLDKLKWPCWWTDETQKTVSPRVKVPIAETWSALESQVITKENPNGILRSIGVANFQGQLIYDLLRYAKIQPAVNQIEHHPYLVQPELVQLLQEEGIAVTAYSSFGPQSFIELDSERAKSAQPLFEHPVVKKISDKYGKTPAQVLLRWATERNIIVIPKSNNAERLKQNLDANSFNLTKEELAEISGLDKGLRFNDPSELSTPLRIFA